jgi:hypothetical protein
MNWIYIIVETPQDVSCIYESWNEYIGMFGLSLSIIAGWEVAT